MLVLTRKAGEMIVIGGGVRIYIMEIRGNKVRVGIEAPPEILILREEEEKDSALKSDE
jgi:carbon storage regulator